jgi:uncharacterized BrkB/YihY/UPF0761 family membrane protein
MTAPARPWTGYWRTVGRFAIWGPLLGGLPYNVFLVPIPFSYAFGLLPAVLCGLGFAWWWLAPQRRVPGWRWRALFGAVFGLLGCAVAALMFGLRPGFAASASDLGATVALHGVPAGALVGAWQRPPVPRQA